MGYTVVSFHAHPDDEAILTAGTLARAASEGHRVVLVCATNGGQGLTGTGGDGAAELAGRREEELRAAAAALGCAAVRFLGYGDSGMDGMSPAAPGLETFCSADPHEAADRLARILREEDADVVTIYDPAGGYGHPDHRRVHQVGRAAAEAAGTAVVLEATVDRRPLLRLLRGLERTRILGVFGADPTEWSSARFASAFAEPERITHRVDVRSFSAAKRAAMASHRSQATGGDATRTLALFVRLPGWLFRWAFGHEWFAEQGRVPGPRPLDDIFASLRDGPVDC